MKSEKVRMSLLFAFALLLFTFAANAAVEIEQSISYAKGWNLVYVKVAPNKSADELFKDWPVDSVALYDPAAYLDTKQYSAEDSDEGTTRNVMRTWRRGNPGASGFVAVPADSILMFKATEAGQKIIYGEPRAPRITWHPSIAGAPMNFVGISTWAESPVADYFSGSGVLLSDCFTIWGSGDTPQQAAWFNGQKLKDGIALAVDAERPRDWSGVLCVSPRDGLDFGTEGLKATLEIRNDGATNAVVKIEMTGETPEHDTDIDPVPLGLYVRDSLDAMTNGPWTAFSTSTALQRELAAGEMWKIAFALDRLQLAAPSGTEYGAILDIRNVTPNGGNMRVDVPIKVTSDGGASSEFAWPKGVWVTAAELDAVNFMVTSGDSGTFKKMDEGIKKAGGRMSVRLPLYVDDNGTMTLLQRLWFGRNTNGVLRAYSGAIKTSDEPLSELQRLSTPFLPTDQPEIAFSSGSVFGRTALASFVVGENSHVNPMRHAQHPQHDGLTTDYKNAAPSGDNFNNYIGLVKPELFSVSNRVNFAWDQTQAAMWNPEETLTGELTWEFDGLRHEGTVRAKGRFAMKRISPVAVKMK